MSNRRFIFTKRLKSLVYVAVGGGVSFCGICLTLGDEKFYTQVVMPAARCLDPETAHRAAVLAAKFGIVSKPKIADPLCLKTTVWGLEFSNPLGMAAGFDKHGEAFVGLCKMGFGFVEVGSVTPEPQPGNPKPRVYRLTEDKAIINRYGFNSDGHQIVSKRIQTTLNNTCLNNCVLGINLGMNKNSEEPWQDYVRGVEVFGAMADYLVVNVSSPNTPGLRELQYKKALENIIDKVLEAREKLQCKRKPPLLVKISPDLRLQDMKDVAEVVLRKKSKVDGLIVTNTTASRPVGLQSVHWTEYGGLSGQPLRDLSTETIRDIYKMTQGRIPIIGVGGVSTGRDAYEKIKAGATLIQLYSALVYEGPVIITRIKTELEELLKSDGYESVSEAVGADYKKR